MGNNLGPLQPCMKSTFLFSGPNPLGPIDTKHVNENVGGIALTVATN